MSMYSFYTEISTNKFLEAENSHKLEAEFKPFNILLLRHEDIETLDVAFQHFGEHFRIWAKVILLHHLPENRKHRHGNLQKRRARACVIKSKRYYYCLCLMSQCRASRNRVEKASSPSAWGARLGIHPNIPHLTATRDSNRELRTSFLEPLIIICSLSLHLYP